MTKKQINAIKQIVRYADITDAERKRWSWVLGYPMLRADHYISNKDASQFIGKYIKEASEKYREHKWEQKIKACARYKTVFDYCD